MFWDILTEDYLGDSPGIFTGTLLEIRTQIAQGIFSEIAPKILSMDFFKNSKISFLSFSRNASTVFREFLPLSLTESPPGVP